MVYQSQHNDYTPYTLPLWKRLRPLLGDEKFYPVFVLILPLEENLLSRWLAADSSFL
jgi:hypothetical protein